MPRRTALIVPVPGGRARGRRTPARTRRLCGARGARPRHGPLSVRAGRTTSTRRRSRSCSRASRRSISQLERVERFDNGLVWLAPRPSLPFADLTDCRLAALARLPAVRGRPRRGDPAPDGQRAADRRADRAPDRLPRTRGRADRGAGDRRPLDGTAQVRTGVSAAVSALRSAARARPGSRRPRAPSSARGRRGPHTPPPPRPTPSLPAEPVAGGRQPADEEVPHRVDRARHVAAHDRVAVAVDPRVEHRPPRQREAGEPRGHSDARVRPNAVGERRPHGRASWSRALLPRSARQQRSVRRPGLAGAGTSS